MSKFSEKSISFCKKILKHYPLPNQANSERKESQPIQPYSHMHDHRKERQIYEKPTHQKLQNMQYFKQLGNKKFQQGKRDQAIYFYQKAIIYGDYTFPDSKIDVFRMQLLLQQTNINAAICFIKNNEWAQAEVHLRETIKQGSKAFQNSQSQIYPQSDIKKIKQLENSKLQSLKKGYYWYTKFYINKLEFTQAEQTIEKLRLLDAKISSKEEAEELMKLVEQKQSQNLSKKMLASSKIQSSLSAQN